MDIRCSDLAAATGGQLIGDDVVVSGAAIDSRTVRAGQLFVAVVAERDGHEFIDDALAAGAAAVLLCDPSRLPDAPAVIVGDTTEGLQAAGRYARDRLTGPVVGVTGSVGKTSVKDLLASVLSQRMLTAASERSFNNELGVPLTLLNAPDGAEAAVVEMGARGIGHVADLCAIAAPTIGIVTRVAAAHTELFGSIDEVARAKGELVESLPRSGAAVLNADDERVAAMADRTSARVVTYGAAGDVRAESVQLGEDLRGRFRLVSPWGEIDVELGVAGRHQVDNGLAAATAGLVCDLSLEDVAAGLAAGVLSPWRMELGRTASGALVLNDAYNANPTSVVAALESLASLAAERRVAVLGVMAELGADSDEAHAEVAERARALGVRVIAVGAPAYGAETVADIDEALAALGGIGPGDAVLVKGSRVAGLERLAQRLLAG